MASRRSSAALLVALSGVWGSSWIANDLLRQQGAPLWLAAMRYLLAAALAGIACCIGIMLKRDGTLLRASLSTKRSRMAVSLVLGITMFSLPDLLLVWAGEQGASPFTPLVYSALPLGLMLAGGQLRVPAILAIGAMLVLLNGSLPLSGPHLGWALLIALAVTLQGWSLIFARRHLEAAASLAGVSVQLLLAGLFLLVASYIHSGQRLALSWSLSSVGGLVYGASLATALAYPLYYSLLATFTPAQLAASQWLQTLVAAAESAMLIRQRPSLPMSLAGVALFACAILSLRSEPADPQTALRLAQES